MSDCNHVKISWKYGEISWGEFCAMTVEPDYYKQQELKKQGIRHKHKSGGQWICWTKDDGEFLPNCKGKLKCGSNI